MDYDNSPLLPMLVMVDPVITNMSRFVYTDLMGCSCEELVCHSDFPDNLGVLGCKCLRDAKKYQWKTLFCVMFGQSACFTLWVSAFRASMVNVTYHMCYGIINSGGIDVSITND
jgi:hypothetical protein